MPKKTCYACYDVATSREHVPPKCIFPENKDLPAGETLRTNLITVPSCDVHNSNKSEDDHYLMYALCLSIANNKTAFQHFTTKIMRSAEKDSSKVMSEFLRSQVPVLAVDGDENSQNTIAVNVDMHRVVRCADHMGRAIYFSENGRRFVGSVSVLDDFTLDLNAPATKECELMIRGLRDYFSDGPWSGENPGVFQYQLHFDEGSSRHLGVLQFYGATHLYLVYTPDKAMAENSPDVLPMQAT